MACSKPAQHASRPPASLVLSLTCSSPDSHPCHTWLWLLLPLLEVITGVYVEPESRSQWSVHAKVELEVQGGLMVKVILSGLRFSHILLSFHPLLTAMTNLPPFPRCVTQTVIRVKTPEKFVQGQKTKAIERLKIHTKCLLFTSPCWYLKLRIPTPSIYQT